MWFHIKYSRIKEGLFYIVASKLWPIILVPPISGHRWNFIGGNSGQWQGFGQDDFRLPPMDSEILMDIRILLFKCKLLYYQKNLTFQQDWQAGEWWESCYPEWELPKPALTSRKLEKAKSEILVQSWRSSWKSCSPWHRIKDPRKRWFCCLRDRIERFLIKIHILLWNPSN